MAAKENETIAPFVISRQYDAPRDLVWKAWTDAERLAKWWGPKGFTVRVSKVDLRPGGIHHFCLRGPDGKDMWGKWVFREIVPPEKLVWVHSFSDEQGGVATHPMAPTWPRETLSTLTLTERQGKTIVQINWVPMQPTEEERQTFEAGRGSMNQGWTGTLDQLEGFLAERR